jgi:hypothetical protein
LGLAPAGVIDAIAEYAGQWGAPSLRVEYISFRAIQSGDRVITAKVTENVGFSACASVRGVFRAGTRSGWLTNTNHRQNVTLF